MNELFVTKKCPCCGKEFILHSYDWVYKMYDNRGNRLWYCSYSCFTKTKREREAKKPKKVGCVKQYIVGVNNMIFEHKSVEVRKQYKIKVEAMTKTEARKLAVEKCKKEYSELLAPKGWLEADWCKEVKR